MAGKNARPEMNAKWLGAAMGIVLTVFVGFLLEQHPGEGVARLSYDLAFDVPFEFSSSRSQIPEELIMVYLDTGVKRNLGQPIDQPLDRHFYSLLLNRLIADQARLVLFDILFDEPHPDPAVDLQFAEAIRQHGHVVLVGGYERAVQGNLQMDMPVPPTAVLTSAANWGSAKCEIDPDYGIRKLAVGTEEEPSAGWVAAATLGAAVTNQPPSHLAGAWLNFYCPPGQLRAVNLDQAIATNALPAGYFRDKIVIVGARPGVGLAGDKREVFRSPYSFIGCADAPGPAVQAFNILNLVHGNWLNRMSPVAETILVVVWGTLIVLVFMALRPAVSIITGLGSFVGIALIAFYSQRHSHIWFNWLVPGAIQPSIALVWGVSYRYVVADRRRRQLRRAFGAYLSPYMADKISNSEFDLELGGQEVEASVMFTDLEGFTKMSESLPPAEVSKILTTYFNHATRAILRQDGTIIKYIGDAVLAVWGAPLPEKRHAQRAVLAAWGMSEAGKEEIQGRRLRTRIGVSTGMMLAGNLGSNFRFDYTVIGDTVNFAARLEGLNKYLGTEVLISEFTVRQLDGDILLRPLGRFIVVGKQNAIGIYEVLGLAKDFPQVPPWLEAFNRAREHYVKRELAVAEGLMREVITQRGGKDGPAEFYLREITRAQELPADAPWDGSLKIDSK